MELDVVPALSEILFLQKLQLAVHLPTEPDST
jgi:hypothetical protein